MAEIKHGSLTVTIDDFLKPPEQAGKMSPDEVARIPKPPRGLGKVCDEAADSIEKAGSSFAPPSGVTPQSLRDAGRRAEEIDLVLLHLDMIQSILKQANTLFDAAAWDQIRMVNDQIKAQSKRHPDLSTIFKPVTDFFARGPRKSKAEL